MKNRGMRFLTALILAGTFIYFSIKIFPAFFSDSGTYTVNESVLEDSSQVNGILTRNEVLINSSPDSGDYYETSVKTGTKVRAGDYLASSFSGGISDVATLKYISDIDSKINQYENAQSRTDSFGSEVSKVEKEIDSYASAIAGAGVSGNLGNYYSDENNLNINIFRREILTGVKKNYKEEIAQLNSKKAEVNKTSFKGSSAKVYAPCAGYYIAAVDGLENTMTTDFVRNMSLSDFEAAVGKDVEIDYNCAGKIVKDFSWYYTFPVDTAYAEEKLSVGKTISLRFVFSDNTVSKAVVTAIDEKENGKSLVTVSGDNYFYELNINRTIKADVIFNEYKGLRIPSEALRVVDSKKGVYCRIGAKVVFKEVDIAFSRDGYSIVDSDMMGKSDLLLYDEVYVNGKNLYDGKIIK